MRFLVSEVPLYRGGLTVWHIYMYKGGEGADRVRQLVVEDVDRDAGEMVDSREDHRVLHEGVDARPDLEVFRQKEIHHLMRGDYDSESACESVCAWLDLQLPFVQQFDHLSECQRERMIGCLKSVLMHGWILRSFV